MVLREEIIEIEYCPEDENGKKQTNQKKKLRLKKVCYQDEKNRYFEFITNSMESTAEEVAFLYKKRWGIELLFYALHIVMQSDTIRLSGNQSNTSNALQYRFA